MTVGPAASVPALTEGRDYRLVKNLPVDVDGKRADYVANLDGDTTLAVLDATEDDKREAGTPPPDHLVSVDPASGTTQLLARATADGMTSIAEVSQARGFIIWLQSDANSYDSLNWDLYSYETETETKRRIASSSELGIKDPPWPSYQSIRPQIVGNHVYWAAVESAKGSSVSTAIYEAPLNGASSMTKVIDDATDVYADGDDLWFRRDGRMLAWDVSAGVEKKADTARVTKPCGGHFHEGTLVQVDCAGKGSLVITEKSGRRTTLRDVDHPGYLNTTSRWVGYSVDDQAYVYDLKRQRLMRLKGSQGYSAKDFSGNRMLYIRQHFGTPDDPYEPTYPYIALLPE